MPSLNSRLKWSRLILSLPFPCRSHNPLGDDGLRELLVGIKRLRARDIGSHLEVRLQLASDVAPRYYTDHII